MTIRSLAIIADDMSIAGVPYWKPGSDKNAALAQIGESASAWLAENGYDDVTADVEDVGDFEDGDDALKVTLRRGDESRVRGVFKVGNAPEGTTL